MLTVNPGGVAKARPTASARAAVPPHIPSLDGLRAVSFLIVFTAHSGITHGITPGGFGVTVFFFLSGYLITTLMRLERETTGAVSVRNFYLRRALRILPPFYLVLVLATALALLNVLPGQLRLPTVLAQMLHVSNYWFIWHGYDGSPAGTVPYWSLAVEEHFYLLFPMFYLFLNRKLSNRGQARAIWTCCLIICAWRCALALGLGASVDRTYMASDTRFDSILFGCALAIGLNPMLDREVGSERLWKFGLLPAGLVILLVTFVYQAPWFRETIRYSLQGIGLTPLFVTAIRFPKWPPFRVLNSRIVSFVGVLSYTMYLVHQVVLYAIEFQLPTLDPLVRAPLALGVSLLIALAIHQWIEKPSARLRKRMALKAAA